MKCLPRLERVRGQLLKWNKEKREALTLRHTLCSIHHLYTLDSMLIHCIHMDTTGHAQTNMGKIDQTHLTKSYEHGTYVHVSIYITKVFNVFLILEPDFDLVLVF